MRRGFAPAATRLGVCAACLMLILLLQQAAAATTIGGAMGNGSEDGRPIVWKNRDGGVATGSNRHFISLVTDRTYQYLGVHPSDLDPRMGLSEVGIAFGNALGYPADNSATFTDSPNYQYSNNQAFKQYVMGETANLVEVRQAIADTTLGNANHWPTSLGIMAGIFDAQGKVSLWEIGDEEYYEYNPENPNRLAQIPWQIYARDNTVHTRTDHTDNWDHTDERYTQPRDQLIGNAAAGGNSIADMIRVARIGEPGYSNLPSREITSASMIAHGVLPGEDPLIATMWTALGQPDYAVFIPTWVAVGGSLSPRVSSNALDTSLSGAAEKMWAKREAGDYDAYLNGLFEPMESNFIAAVEAARSRWFANGFQPDEALRIHTEASETAWHTMDVMAAGTGRSLNVTPELTDLAASVSGSTVSFGATAGDPDGAITSYDWDFGDGTGSSEAAPVHSYAQSGTYLVRVRVTDDAGARNSRWSYVTIDADGGLPLVTIDATDPVASEAGGDSGTFTITRTGTSTGALSVNFSLTGEALEGVDYQSVGSSVTIPDGQTSTTLVIEPVDDLLSEAPEAVVATLTSGAGYAVGSTANATVTIEDNETALVFGEGDIWRYFKGVTFPGADWNALSFDDGSWLTGPSGLGYGDGDDNTVLDDMRGNYLTVYMRRDFTIADPTAVTSLSLSVDYDDGFVAFINGTEVARAGVPQGQDEGTLATGHEAGSPEVIDLPAGPGALVPGRNVFAIEVHNATLSSSDLTMIPELTVNSGAGACSDGVDNDADGLTDFPLDPGCESTTDGSERSPDLTCDDGTDNDGDGLVDLADPGCSEPADTTETSSGLVCDDGIDNDNDGATDFPNDPGCDDGLDASELSDVACDDGIDNDGDGLIDFGSDPGCQSLSDTSEVDDPIILQIPLTTGNDDAEEKSDGSITLTSSDLEMLEYDAGPPHQAVGIRFDGVTIPPGATVSGAYIQFVADQTDSVQTDLTIQAHAIGDAPAFTTATNNITDRPVTTATVEWDVAPWSAGSSGPDQASADVSPILNELIARGDWSAGNAVAFVITGTGERVAASFNASPDPTTTLHLEYVTEPSGNTAPSVAITAPASGTTVVEGTVVNFTGTATDAEDGDLGSALAWSSSLTGALGTGSAISTNLSVGVHTITAGATDSGGLLGEAQITVTVEAAPIDVPDVTGQSQASAEAQLIAAGLNVGTITTAASDTVPAGDVLSQDPTACSVCASPGDPVDLVVSSGPSPNTAPNVAITAPASGTTVVEGTVVNFTGTANDAEDGDLGSALVWSSSEDGALGTGSAIATNLSVGSHTITAAATDSGGLVGSDQITVTVTAAPVDVPDVTGQTQADAEASLVAAGLSVGDVTVQSSTSVPAGVVIDQSPTACSVCASPGDPVDLVVSSGPANTAPGVTITTPADGTSIVEGTQLDLGATATDAEDGDLTSAITWSSSEDGALGGGGVVSVSVSVGVHIITASVTDTGGLVGSDQITVTVTAAPIDVPDVTGQSQADAEAELVAAGLSVGVITTAVSDTVPAGNVLSQDPSACSVCASPGDPVDLVVSSGPPANTAPTLTITAPANNSTAVEGVAVTFTATASDAEQGDLSGTVVWSSNRDGILGSGASLSVPLTRGRHVITATVTDAGGLQGSGQVVVRVRRDRS